MLRHCDSFDTYEIPSKGTIIRFDGISLGNGNPYDYSVLPGNGRTSASDSNTGGYYTNASFALNGFAGLYKNIGANVTTVIVGFALKIVSNWGNWNYAVCSLYDGATTQVDLELNGSGQFLFSRNGTQLGSASASMFVPNQWHYVEVKVLIDGSVGTCELRVDGTNTGWISLTGQNTKATGNSYVNRVGLGPNGIFVSTSGNSNQNPQFYYDDFYVCDTSGSYNNNFLGDVRVNGQLATGNGSAQQWTRAFASWPGAAAVVSLGQTITDGTHIQRVTAVTGDAKVGGSAPSWNATLNGTTTDNHATWTNEGTPSDYLAVNELPTPDGDSSYVADANVGDKELFTFPAMAGTSVLAVVVWMYARKDDATTRAIRAIAKSGATTADSGVDLALSTSYAYQMGLFETDPSTGVGWSVAAVNAAEYGAKVTV